MTYNKLREVTSELVTAVLHNKSQYNNVLRHLTEWVRKIRRKESFQPTFIKVTGQVHSTTKNGSTLTFVLFPEYYHTTIG